MAGVWLAQGINAFVASGLTVNSWLDTLSLRLFVNNFGPSKFDIDANYTEATFPGYAPIATPAWSAGGIDGNGNYQWNGGLPVFTSGGGSGDTVYGYYLTDGSGLVVIAEAAGTPFPISSGGLTYSVELHFYLGNIDPPV